MYSSIRFAFTENSKEFNVDCLHRRDNSLNIQKKVFTWVIVTSVACFWVMSFSCLFSLMRKPKAPFSVPYTTKQWWKDMMGKCGFFFLQLSSTLYERWYISGIELKQKKCLFESCPEFMRPKLFQLHIRPYT